MLKYEFQYIHIRSLFTFAVTPQFITTIPQFLSIYPLDTQYLFRRHLLFAL